VCCYWRHQRSLRQLVHRHGRRAVPGHRCMHHQRLLPHFAHVLAMQRGHVRRGTRNRVHPLRRGLLRHRRRPGYPHVHGAVPCGLLLPPKHKLCHAHRHKVRRGILRGGAQLAPCFGHCFKHPYSTHHRAVSGWDAALLQSERQRPLYNGGRLPRGRFYFGDYAHLRVRPGLKHVPNLPQRHQLRHHLLRDCHNPWFIDGCR